MDDITRLEIMKAAAEGAAKESVNQVSNIFTTIFPFCGLKKKAIDTYIKEIQNSNLAADTKMITIANTKKTFKHLKNQSDIITIALDNAAPETDFSIKSKINIEWLERYIDSSKFVSDQDMQYIWGKILSKEFENPGNTPLQIIRILSEITPEYARKFNIICNCETQIFHCNNDKKDINHTMEIIVNHNSQFWESLDISFKTLCELENLGLINFNTSGYVAEIPKEEYLFVIYGDNSLRILDYTDKYFQIGNVLLTDAGMCIFNVLQKEYMNGYFEDLKQYFGSKKIPITEETNINIIDKYNIEFK